MIDTSAILTLSSFRNFTKHSVVKYPESPSLMPCIAFVSCLSAALKQGIPRRGGRNDEVFYIFFKVKIAVDTFTFTKNFPS